jgi:hypothetical protein
MELICLRRFFIVWVLRKYPIVILSKVDRHHSNDHLGRSRGNHPSFRRRYQIALIVFKFSSPFYAIKPSALLFTSCPRQISGILPPSRNLWRMSIIISVSSMSSCSDIGRQLMNRQIGLLERPYVDKIQDHFGNLSSRSSGKGFRDNARHVERS